VPANGNNNEDSKPMAPPVTRAPVRVQRDHPVDLDQLAQQIENDMSAGVQRLPVPRMDQVQRQPDIGKLSADAVLEQFKMAAKSVEEMGEEVQERIRALEAAIHECNSDMQLLREAADAIREKGKHAHAEIERTSAVSKDIRDIVAQIKAKIG
jgi:methyl-accepting chemotaxis protein